jgi:hypothetical protein
MVALLTPDLRFDQPVLQTLVDLMNRTLSQNIPYENVELVAVEPFVDPGLTTDDMRELRTFTTRAQLRVLMAGDEAAQEVEIVYERLVLATYLYRTAVLAPDATFPAVLVDFYDTTPETTASDALAYLDSEYNVQITAEECVIDSQIGSPFPDGSWSVVITPIATNPIWVGPVVLRARQIAAP